MIHLLPHKVSKLNTLLQEWILCSWLHGIWLPSRVLCLFEACSIHFELWGRNRILPRFLEEPLRNISPPLLTLNTIFSSQCSDPWMYFRIFGSPHLICRWSAFDEVLVIPHVDVFVCKDAANFWEEANLCLSRGTCTQFMFSPHTNNPSAQYCSY